MAQYIKQGNIFGRIGTGLGKGLAEQIPKEIERNRLSSGLKELGENPSMPPIERLSKLYESGATPEQVNQITPYLRNAEIIAQRNKGMPQGQPGQPQMQPGQPQPGQPGQPQRPQAQPWQPEQPKETLKTATAEQAARQPIPVVTEEARDARARQIMAEQPELYQGENAYPNALAKADAELNYAGKVQQEQIAAGERQRAQENSIQKKFIEKAAAKLPQGVVPNDTQQRFQKKAEFDILKNGTSEENATENQTDILKDISKKILTLRNNIGGRPMFGKAPEQLGKDVAKLRPVFEKNGELELFKDEQQAALDIGPHLASVQTWLPKPEQEKIIATLKKDTEPEKIAAILAPTIDDKTSLFTLGYMLDKAGHDSPAVINALSDFKENGLVKLDDRQDREAAEYYSINERPTLGDHLWMSFAGPVGIGLNTFFNYITGKKEKLGPVGRLKQALGKE